MHKKGLSLLELLVSALILALVMVGLANLFIAGKRHILHSRARMTGGELGKYFLDPLQMQVRQDTWDNATNNNLTVGNRTTNVTIAPITYNVTYNITNVTGTTLRRARVTINWTEPLP